MNRLTTLLILCSLSLPLLAEDVLFVKNEWQHRLHVWANDTYQGYVDPGQVAYMPQEGFVTQDSGLQADGSMKMEHAYGGWRITDNFKIVGASVPFEKDGTQVSFYAEGTSSYSRGQYKLWSFGATAGSLSPPAGVETESAVKMRQGREPRDVLALIEKGTVEAESNGSPLTGLASSLGGSYSLKLAGGGDGSSREKIINSVRMTMIWVDQGYYLAATEVTQAQWQAVMGSNPSDFQGPDRPVEQVSWDDAMGFCQRLTQKEQGAGKLPKGYIYILPTEKQWEYACRAGTTGDFAGPLDQMGWYYANSSERTYPSNLAPCERDGA